MQKTLHTGALALLAFLAPIMGCTLAPDPAPRRIGVHMGAERAIFNSVFKKTAFLCSTNVVSLDMQDDGMLLRANTGSMTADFAHGVIVNSGTQILTARHNIEALPKVFAWKDGQHININYSEVFIHAQHDLAILTIDPGLALPSFDIASPDRVGQKLFTYGYGVRKCVLKSVERTGSARFYYHNAKIAKGESGSALFDTRGRLVGVNISRTSGGTAKAIMLDDLIETARSP